MYKCLKKTGLKNDILFARDACNVLHVKIFRGIDEYEPLYAIRYIRNTRLSVWNWVVVGLRTRCNIIVLMRIAVGPNDLAAVKGNDRGIIDALESRKTLEIPLQRGQHSPGSWTILEEGQCRTGQACFAQISRPALHLQVTQGSSVVVTDLSAVTICPFT